ncbi:MAG: hypothetical protein ABIR59_03395 [Gemmatimonadales bacterium]
MFEVTAPEPGEGANWERLAAWLCTQVPAHEVDAVWVFRVLRRDQREFGTAVVSRVEGDRRRIYTARYAAIVKGKQRGGFETWLEEVGTGPIEALHALLELVPVRADDEDPPTPVGVRRWFPEEPDRQLELEPIQLSDELADVSNLEAERQEAGAGHTH